MAIDVDFLFSVPLLLHSVSSRNVVVIDFGLARDFKKYSTGVMGTPGYMPPEASQVVCPLSCEMSWVPLRFGCKAFGPSRATSFRWVTWLICQNCAERVSRSSMPMPLVNFGYFGMAAVDKPIRIDPKSRGQLSLISPQRG